MQLTDPDVIRFARLPGSVARRRTSERAGIEIFVRLWECSSVLMQSARLEVCIRYLPASAGRARMRLPNKAPRHFDRLANKSSL